jgi:hypothetical protein
MVTVTTMEWGNDRAPPSKIRLRVSFLPDNSSFWLAAALDGGDTASGVGTDEGATGSGAAGGTTTGSTADAAMGLGSTRVSARGDSMRVSARGGSSCGPAWSGWLCQTPSPMPQASKGTAGSGTMVTSGATGSGAGGT